MHKLLSYQIQLPANVELDNLIAKFFTVYIVIHQQINESYYER